MTAQTDVAVVRAEGFGATQIVPALGAAGTAFVELLRALDPAEGERPVPGMTWTVAETAVHMLNVLRRGLGDRRRSETVEGLAELNDLSITEVPERDVSVIADMMETDLRTYLDLLSGVTDEQGAGSVVRLHAGLKADLPTALSYQLFDFLGHGYDIATATGRDWVLPSDQLVLGFRACVPALGPWVLDEVLAGTSRRVELTFPGVDFALVAEVGEGRYEVHAAERGVAAEEVDPAEAFLTIAGRRASQDPVIAELASWYRPI